MYSIPCGCARLDVEYLIKEKGTKRVLGKEIIGGMNLRVNRETLRNQVLRWEPGRKTKVCGG